MRTCQPHLAPIDLPDAYEGNVYRARFSSLAPDDLRAAYTVLAHPDLNASRSVDARQVIDLKLGVAFSRFQTRFFRRHLGQQLGKLSVTYGPCQTPCLWFCCHRHDQIVTFEPQPYWSVEATASLGAEAAATTCTLRAACGDVWAEAEARAVVASAGAAPKEAVAQGVAMVNPRSLARPLPLNTVSMLKCASERLQIGAGDAMHYAEKLYLGGLLSYPRTETTKYAAGFDLVGTLRVLAAAEWLPEAAALLELVTAGAPERLHERARADGEDVGDHPPITPVKLGTPKSCGDAPAWELYQLICRHFVATLLEDCRLQDATLHVAIGAAAFVATTTRCSHPGWLPVLQLEAFGEGDDTAAREELFRAMTRVQPGAPLALQYPPRTRSHWTQPPPHLSESELLALMEEHSIGTDASMATHVTNVIRRGYVELDEGSRALVPAPLGLALVHAYTLIDEGLVLPCVRASIEAACRRIANGTATFEAVVDEALGRFRRRFDHFTSQAHRLPSMLAAALSQGQGFDGGEQTMAAVDNATWMQAVRKVAAVDLAELQDAGSARVLAALRGPAPATRPPGLGLAPPQAQPPLGLATADGGTSVEVGDGAEAQAAITAAQQQLERLGYGQAHPPAAEPTPAAPAGGNGAGAADDASGRSSGGNGKKKKNRSKGGKKSGEPMPGGSGAITMGTDGMMGGTGDMGGAAGASAAGALPGFPPAAAAGLPPYAATNPLANPTAGWGDALPMPSPYAFSATPAASGPLPPHMSLVPSFEGQMPPGLPPGLPPGVSSGVPHGLSAVGGGGMGGLWNGGGGPPGYMGAGGWGHSMAQPFAYPHASAPAGTPFTQGWSPFMPVGGAGEGAGAPPFMGGAGYLMSDNMAMGHSCAPAGPRGKGKGGGGASKQRGGFRAP